MPDMDEAKTFLDAEIGDLSTLDRAAQEAEMQWFVDAAKPFAGMDIKVVSETITTHEYESKVLAPAFTAITGIKITHDLIGEGDVVEKLQTQMQSGENIYDAYINDSRPDRHALALPAGAQPDRLDGQRRQGRHQSRTSISTTSSARRSRPRRTASSTSCPTSSSRTSTGSATTGSTTRRTRPTSRRSTATTSAFRSTGRPTRTSPSSSPAARSTARRSMATWTTARRTRRSAGASPTPGCRWPAMATRACRTACRSTNGASRSTRSRAGRLLRRPRRRHQRPGRGLFDREVSRLAEGLRTGRRPGHDLLRIRSGALAGRGRPADVHVHGLHRRLREGRPAGRERGRHAEVALRSVAAWRLLEGRHEARLPGRRFLDAAEVHAGRPRQGRLALCAVRHLEDRGREEEPCRPDLHPRVDDPAQVASPTARRSSAV